jgi:hypothetical protein
LSGIVNALLVVGVLFAGVYVFQHKDELLSQLNLGGGGSPAAATPSATEPASAAPDGDAPATATSTDTPAAKEDSDKATTKPVDKKTSDKTYSTKEKKKEDTSKKKCKKGYKYDSKKKKCIKDKKSHLAFIPHYYNSYYNYARVMKNYSFTDIGASPRISL